MSLNDVVPLLAVSDMKRSLAFYKDGLGFSITQHWADQGAVKWCRLQNGKAGLMLQEFATEGIDSRKFSEGRGEGVSICIFCDDAIAYHQEITARGIDAQDPFEGNGLWVTSVRDPDGYQFDFESPINAASEVK
ncbi:MAG TPA: VOC family protein [Candidatus Methylacidiphilales bacterium]|nr:VOC family protein [Candidatus Methylacidiphilales bacterium]